ncbi:PASTA domain-containing protein [Mucilaginibacter myungsuensis]|uniref:PASTA domain-containing protein n=1 Tax=Mucilaginibacter myungsuensis TaxID=649104 RepID=A0A929L361_9SPHI|nr:PASTA domain-containing protein [Mucilaginibacter myungsuensis]MBE9663614.1 PASTA domain-containing protein [Mucilaginibacter myungsuensis]MDN3599062.1 PASTA domain-containing protein [Mucilaginibacter myungsuensis]
MGKLWAYFKTKAFLKNLLGAIGVVVGIVLIAFFSLSYYTRHGEGIPVPSLKGLTKERAMAILDEQGFEYKIDSVYVPDKVPGTVTEQDPDAGTNVKEGRTIYLMVVTTLAPNVTLPDLKDNTYLEAVAILANYGLKVGDTTYRADIARNHVLEVTFSGRALSTGDKLPKGSVVDLVLGDGAGAAEQEIPDLVNMDLDAAKMAIKGIGLAVGDVIYQGPITDSANLVVVQQFPARTDSTSKVSIGTRVNLTVSQGKKLDEQ